MTRALPEWVARHDNAAIPPRVKERLARKANDCCVKCTRKTDEKLKGEADHIIPLIIGGRHRESNLQWLCVECHSNKTKLDVKLKARIAKSRIRNLGLKQPSRLRSAGFRKAAPQRTASRPIQKGATP